MQGQGRLLLREWLTRSRLKQKELAAQLGISNPHLCHILSGERRASLELLHRIERVSGVPILSWLDTKRGRSVRYAGKPGQAASISGAQINGAQS